MNVLSIVDTQADRKSMFTGYEWLCVSVCGCAWLCVAVCDAPADDGRWMGQNSLHI